MLHFFFHLGFLSKTSQRLTLLTQSTLKSWRARVYPGKIQDESHLWPVRWFYGWVPPGNPPALKQELRIEGEQVRYFNIQVSFVAFRSNARVKQRHSRHPFLAVTRGWLLRSHVTVSILNVHSSQLLVNKKKNNNKEANDDFTLHTKTSARCYILNTRTY